MRQKKPSATPDELKNALTGTATAMTGGVAVVGAGRVNAVGAVGTLSCSPRPTIGRSLTTVNAGRLRVILSTSGGAFSSITTTGLRNATLEVNGVSLPQGSTATISGTSATVFVQQTGAGAPFTARFNVVDTCGAYPLFFGKGS